jgi:plastocyanin
MVKMTNSLTRVLIGLSVAICCCVISAPLRPSRATAAEAQVENQQPYKRTGAEGAVTGQIRFEGEAPARRKLDMSQDANCAAVARNPRTEDVVVTDGRLANVFVYVKGGSLENTSFETPQTPASLDQRQCRFVPRVLGIQTGQSLIFFNSDPTTHNIHPVPRVNPEWNQMQARDGMPLEKRFSREETLIPVKCNQHPWMRAYVGVLAHPFFAVSARNGSFKIEGLPQGEYTVVAWHEVLGEQTVKLSIGPMETKSIDLVFTTRRVGRSPGSLRMESPLIVEQ